MRFIRKKAQYYHYSLSRANEKPPQTAEQATSRWDSFNKKKDLQNLLLEEQFYLCAYSEIRPDLKLLPDLKQMGAHIEHIEPKSQHPGRTFDYQNLVACALSEHDLTQIILVVMLNWGSMIVAVLFRVWMNRVLRHSRICRMDALCLAYT